jgi:hypothetical protein
MPPTFPTADRRSEKPAADNPKLPTPTAAALHSKRRKFERDCEEAVEEHGLVQHWREILGALIVQQENRKLFGVPANPARIEPLHQIGEKHQTGQEPRKCGGRIARGTQSPAAGLSGARLDVSREVLENDSLPTGLPEPCLFARPFMHAMRVTAGNVPAKELSIPVLRPGRTRFTHQCVDIAYPQA